MFAFRRGRAILAVGVLLLAAILAGCGGSSEASQPAASSQVAEASEASGVASTTTEAPSGQSFTRDNWATLIADPDDFKGSDVDIVGRVLGAPEKDEDGTHFQMYADPKNYEWSTIVAVEDPTLVLADGDYVHVAGTVKGKFEGENAFGATVTAVAVLADTVEVVDATALAGPPLRTVTLGKSIDQHGVVVAVEKVEFGADETRAYVTVSNNTAEKASFYDFNAKAIQGQTQHDAEYSEYPAVQSELLSGIVSSGIVLFPAIDPKQATKLYLEARSENYEVEFTPYVFEIAGE